MLPTVYKCSPNPSPCLATLTGLVSLDSLLVLSSHPFLYFSYHLSFLISPLGFTSLLSCSLYTHPHHPSFQSMFSFHSTSIIPSPPSLSPILSPSPPSPHSQSLSSTSLYPSLHHLLPPYFNHPFFPTHNAHLPSLLQLSSLLATSLPS